MITLFGSIIITIIITVVYESRKSKKSKYAAVSMFGGFIGALIGLFSSMIIGAMAPVSLDQKDEKVLVSFADANATNGSFFLGTGSVESKPVYFFYYRTEDDAIRQDRVGTDQGWIYEDAESGGKLIIFEEKLSDKWLLWGIPTGGRQYHFHVPEGTVLRQFNADLK